MQEGRQLARCSSCGAEGPREEMFGAEPDLFCETCADRIRERTARTPTGRMMDSFVGGATPVTATILGIAAVLFVCTHLVYGTRERPYPEWLLLLMPSWKIAVGEAWRLVTSALIHGGWLHVIFNCVWIWSLGRAVESTRGSLRLALFFLGSAAFASAVQWYFQGGAVGLSGVLYALAGFLWMRRRVDAVAASVMNPYTARMLGMWFVICILIPSLKVANWAHGGGLVWGLAAGWASTQEKPVRWFAALAAVTGAAVWWVSTGHFVR